MISCRQKVKIICNTEEVILGDNIDVLIKGLEPDSTYFVHLQLLYDDQSLYSYVAYRANENGCIDLDTTNSLSGSFVGYDSLGLYSYLLKEKAPDYLTNTLLENKEAVFHFQVSRNEEVLATKRVRITRHFESENCFSIDNDLLKLDMHHVDSSDVLVLVWGGSEGGNYGSNYLAKQLALKGYSSAAISYFGGTYQFKSLIERPIELIDSARNYITQQVGDFDHVVLLGVSRGAELALLYASYREDVQAVFAIAPSCYVYQAYSDKVLSAWTIEAEPVPFVELVWNSVERDSSGKAIYKNMFVESMAKAPSSAFIPVENINGDIFLFSGQADLVWPSANMANLIEQGLNNSHFDHAFSNYQYEDAGHGIVPPGYFSLVNWDSPYAMGGSVKANAQAKVDIWNIVLDYLANID